MSEPTPPSPTPNAPIGGAEPPKPADAAAKKQTVRISLPPKPAAGPSIRIPAAPAAAAPAAAAPAAPAAAAPAAAPAAAAAPKAAAPAAPAPAPAKPAPAPRPAAPSSVSMLDVILAFLTAAAAIGTAVIVFMTSKISEG